jgi:hypothetical protein
MKMADGDAITGLIPTVLAIGIVKKTSEVMLGDSQAKARPFPKMTLPKGGLFKK